MRRSGESGQALVLTAIALVTLLAVVGLAIDMGVLRYDKRLQQSAADAAAIAGASNLAAGDSLSGIQSGAQEAAKLDGYGDTGTFCTSSSNCPSTGGIGYITVTVNAKGSSCNGPCTGPHTGDPKYVEVLVSDVQPTYFMHVLGVESETVVARAVATDVGSGFGSGGGGGCIVTTAPPSAKLTANNSGLGTSGSVILNAPTCGILDNGNLVANGNANLSIDAASIGVGGTYNAPSGEDCSADPVVGVCPQPCGDGMACGMPYSGDPLAGRYPIPSTSGSLGPVDISGGTCSGTGCSGVTCTVGSTSGPCTIQPGVYDDICIEAGQTVDFSDGGSTTGGLFVITGASTCSNGVDFRVHGTATICNSTNSDCSGMPKSANTGVTFYLGGTTASADISGTATVQLTAPNSGTYEGMLFYQDPNNSATMTLLGTSSSFYQGAIYEPESAQLYFGGNAGFNAQAAYTVIDVGQLTLAGNPDVSINSNYSGLSGGGGPLAGAISTATLVE